MATHSSILAWKNPTDRGVWQAIVHGSQRVEYDLSLNNNNQIKSSHFPGRVLTLTACFVCSQRKHLEHASAFFFFAFLFDKCKSLIPAFQFSSVTQSCPALCDPVNCSAPGLPVYHQLLEFTQTHDHRVSDAIQPSHPLSSPSPPAPNPSQHQSFPMSQLFA